MTYDAKCPSCSYRFGRLWFFRLLPHRAHTCPNCGARFKDQAARAWAWAGVLALPGIAIYALWRSGYFPQWTIVLILPLPLFIGFVLFPYVSKFELISKPSDRNT
jgi:CXXC-20-CXXC protein